MSFAVGKGCEAAVGDDERDPDVSRRGPQERHVQSGEEANGEVAPCPLEETEKTPVWIPEDVGKVEVFEEHLGRPGCAMWQAPSLG